MSLIRSLFLGVAAVLSGALPSGALPSHSDELPDLGLQVEFLRTYDSKDWKQNDLDPGDWKLIQDAEAYVLKHHAVLVRIVTNKEDGWLSCVYALGRSKNPEIVPLYIRLIRQNFYLKEADGSRMAFGYGSKNGCGEILNEYGSILAYQLGAFGDKRAVSALREAVAQGDSAVRKSAYCSLFKLGEYSFDEILAMLGEISFWAELGATVTDPDGPSPDTVMAIISEVRSRDPERAVELYDRIISKLPARSREVACAHFSKILCYEDLKKYDLALKQCEVVLQKSKLEDYTKRIPEMRDRITQQAQDSADQPASAPKKKSEGNEKLKPETKELPR
jgi:hypothetical protein